ncbi:MAG: hypothetical protein JO171_18690 [Paludibacterium sp.]|uniref:hypothetical protein n=1 Tax=Paludibacterium sp. TaxID=1917523 RepID=UPI0025EBAB60|nr:hypothetical protein [Paludibacterium sp.]MBV8049183.1 hypothetical protein [Paludibacterium sp.]MBV8648666.1 hypothetical protein [Paludibacterium sp.]
MATELNSLHVSTLQDRLTRLRQSGGELLQATGLDELLPLFDQAVAAQPRLERAVHSLVDAVATLHAARSLLSSAGEEPVAAASVNALLEAPYRTLRDQAMELAEVL